MYIDIVDGVKDVLRTTALLISVRKFAHSDRDIQTGQVLLGKQDLFGKFLVWEHSIVKRFGAKLNAASHEFCFGVRMQRRKECVSPAHPDIIEIEPELTVKDAISA